MKHGQFQNFWMYQKYHIKMESFWLEFVIKFFYYYYNYRIHIYSKKRAFLVFKRTFEP